MEKIIRNATKNDIEAMRKLWIECFPKDVEYSKFFFEKIFKLECARVCEAGGEIAAMLHSFPYDFATPDGVLHAKYIYGVGTSKKFRSQGIAGALLENEAHDCDFNVIIPQSESLFDFYKRYGYNELFYVGKTVIKSGGDKRAERATVCDIEKLNVAYENMCRGYIRPIRTKERWETILSEFEFLGGGIMLDESGYFVYCEYENEVGVSELCGRGEAVASDVPAITIGNTSALGAARLLSERAKEIFAKGYGRYLNLMHN